MEDKMPVLYFALIILLPGLAATAIDMKYVSKGKGCVFSRAVLYTAVITWLVMLMMISKGSTAVAPDEMFLTLTEFIKYMVPAFAAAVALPFVMMKRLPKKVTDFFVWMLDRGAAFSAVSAVVAAAFVVLDGSADHMTAGVLFKFLSAFIICTLVLALAVRFAPQKLRSAVGKAYGKVRSFLVEDGGKDKSSGTLSSLLAAFAFSFTYVVFAPYETFLGNASEFRFDFSWLWGIVALKGLLIFSFVALMLMFLKGRLKIVATALVFGVTIAGYVQAMLFNGMMHNLDGTETGWSGSSVTVNLIIWIAIAVLPAVICLIIKKHWRKICSAGSALIAGMQVVAMVSLILTSAQPNVGSLMSYAGIYEVSAKNNVIIFVLDKFDQTYVDKMLTAFPNSLDGLKGFTYYPNATGSYCFTHVAIPYLLTGDRIPEYDPTDEQVISQIDNSEYFKYITEHTGSLCIYTDEFNIRSNDARSKIDNCVRANYIVDEAGILEASRKASLYRLLPFKYKQNYVYDSSNFNSALTSMATDDYYSLDDYDSEAAMDKAILKDGLSENKQYGDNSFRFIHVKGAHDRYKLNENAEYLETPISAEDGGLEKTAAGSMKLVSDYLKALNDLGLYKDATVIITADHGNAHVIESDDDTARNVNPIMFFKPAGAGYDQPLKTSNAPVSHDDIFPTVIRALGGDYTKFGRCLDEIGENEDRTRYFYWVFRDLDEPNILTYYHKEYAVTGDARDNANWHETGKIAYANSNPKHAQNAD